MTIHRFLRPMTNCLRQVVSCVGFAALVLSLAFASLGSPLQEEREGEIESDDVVSSIEKDVAVTSTVRRGQPVRPALRRILAWRSVKTAVREVFVAPLSGHRLPNGLCAPLLS